MRLLLALLTANCLAAQPDNNFVYQIFVRSFADTPSDTAPGGPGEIGDLRGLRENLGYLNDGARGRGRDLEAGILWLMPIFPSPSYHGYDISNYRDVNPDYGSLKDLDDLIREAHRRQVRIILDIAFNHTSTQHPWFQSAINSPSSPYRRFYRIREEDGSPRVRHWHVVTNQSGQKIRYFGLFSANMPDLNFDEGEVRAEVKGTAKFWLDRGIDGFRLDAARHIYGDTFEDIPASEILKNADWWREFSDFTYGISPEVLLVGEAITPPGKLRQHPLGLDALLDNRLLRAVRSQVSFPKAKFLDGWARELQRDREVNRVTREGRAKTEPLQTFVFAASHDENPRLASFLEAHKRQGMTASVEEAYRMAMYLVVSLGKYGILYNGDELMQRGVKWNGNPRDHPTQPGDGSGIYDETLREPFPWWKSGTKPPQTRWFLPRFDAANDGVSVEEQQSPGSMLSLARALLKLRNSNPEWANGEIGAILSDSAELLAFEKAGRFLTLINTTPGPRTYRLPEYQGRQQLFWSNGKAKSFKDETAMRRKIASPVVVPPYGFVLLKK